MVLATFRASSVASAVAVAVRQRLIISADFAADVNNMHKMRLM